MTEPTRPSRKSSTSRAFSVALVLGVALTAIGLAVAPALLVVGGALVILVPTGYTALSLRCHPMQRSHRRYDVVGDDIERMISRIGKPSSGSEPLTDRDTRCDDKR